MVEQVIDRVKSTIGNKELAWMFENCFPNTLDTMVDFSIVGGRPDTYVITGDIDAMWLRDSTAQVWPYLPLDEGRPRARATHRGSHQPPDPLHPQGPLRQRLLQGREERSATGRTTSRR